MIKRPLFLLHLLAFAILATSLHAQARFAIYGTVGGEKTEINNTGWTGSGTFGLYYGLAHFGPLSLSVDARGDLSGNMNSGLFGPRLALGAPLFPVKPYFEILGGFSSYSTQTNGAKNTTIADYRYVGGLDSTILPHIDWRIADYSYSAGGIAQGNVVRHPQSLTTGIVLRF